MKYKAYEDAHERDIAAGKALKPDSDMICPECGTALGVIRRNTGHSIICQDMINCHYSRFEPFSKYS